MNCINLQISDAFLGALIYFLMERNCSWSSSGQLLIVCILKH